MYIAMVMRGGYNNRSYTVQFVVAQFIARWKRYSGAMNRQTTRLSPIRLKPLALL